MKITVTFEIKPEKDCLNAAVNGWILAPTDGLELGIFCYGLGEALGRGALVPVKRARITLFTLGQKPDARSLFILPYVR